MTVEEGYHTTSEKNYASNAFAKSERTRLNDREEGNRRDSKPWRYKQRKWT
jgi:hypothetical protein